MLPWSIEDMAKLCGRGVSCEVRRLADAKSENPLYPTLKRSDFILRATGKTWKF